MGGDESVAAGDPLGRFSDRAVAYDAARPSYPREAIDAVLEGAVDVSGLVVADVGAGTGISSRLFAERGCRVIALEPNGAMRAMGESRGGCVEWREGTGEVTGLEDGSVDVVVCAQAFHWMRAGEAIKEFGRVIDRGSRLGRIALMWNIRDASSALMRGYCDVLERYAVDPPRSPWFDDVGRPLEAHGLRNARVERFAHEQSLNEGGFLSRAASASYFPKSGAARENAEAELRRVFAEFSEGGRIVMRYHTEVHLGEVADNGGAD